MNWGAWYLGRLFRIQRRDSERAMTWVYGPRDVLAFPVADECRHRGLLFYQECNPPLRFRLRFALGMETYGD